MIASALSWTFSKSSHVQVFREGMVENLRAVFQQRCNTCTEKREASLANIYLANISPFPQITRKYWNLFYYLSNTTCIGCVLVTPIWSPLARFQHIPPTLTLEIIHNCTFCPKVRITLIP